MAFSPECLSSSDSNDDDEDEELIIGAGLGSGPILQNFIWPKMATITSCPSFNDFFINLNFDLDIFFKLDHFDDIILSTKLNCSGSYNYFSKSIANFATIRLHRHTDWYLRQFVPVKLLIIILLFSTCPSFEAKATNLLFCFQGILTLSDISRKAHRMLTYFINYGLPPVSLVWIPLNKKTKCLYYGKVLGRFCFKDLIIVGQKN